MHESPRKLIRAKIYPNKVAQEFRRKYETNGYLLDVRQYVRISRKAVNQALHFAFL